MIQTNQRRIPLFKTHKLSVVKVIPCKHSWTMKFQKGMITIQRRLALNLNLMIFTTRLSHRMETTKMMLNMIPPLRNPCRRQFNSLFRITIFPFRTLISDPEDNSWFQGRKQLRNWFLRKIKIKNNNINKSESFNIMNFQTLREICLIICRYILRKVQLTRLQL